MKKAKTIALIILITIIALLISCKTKKVNKSKVEVNTEVNVDSAKTAIEASSKTLSEDVVKMFDVNTETVTEIIPDGPFWFSLEDGFNGEAKSVTVTEKKADKTKVEEKTFEKDTTSKEVSERKLSHRIIDLRGTEKDVEKKPSLIPWIGGAIGIIIMILLAWYMRRRKIF